MYDAAFNNIENILRAEDGIANELDYVEQISWLLFLKYLSDLESERKTRAELASDSLGSFMELRYGSVSEGSQKLGDIPSIKSKFVGLQTQIYKN